MTFADPSTRSGRAKNNGVFDLWIVYRLLFSCAPCSSQRTKKNLRHVFHVIQLERIRAVGPNIATYAQGPRAEADGESEGDALETDSDRARSPNAQAGDRNRFSEHVEGEPNIPVASSTIPD